MQINVHAHQASQTSLTIFNLEEGSERSMPFSYGVHPWKAANAFEPSDIETVLADPNCFAVGEVGLDKLVDVPMDRQQAVFRQQIVLSEKWHLPMVLHIVRSWNEVLAIRREISPTQAWIFHGFRKHSILASVLDSGLYVSIGTAILHDRQMQDWVTEIPLDCLFLETDMDAPEYLAEVYRMVAARKKLSLQALEEQIEANFKKVFKRWQSG